MLLPWLDTTFTIRTVPPMAMARPMTTATINRITDIPPFERSGFQAFGLDGLGLGQGTEKVTSVAGPVSFLKLTGTTVAW